MHRRYKLPPAGTSPGYSSHFTKLQPALKRTSICSVNVLCSSSFAESLLDQQISIQSRLSDSEPNSVVAVSARNH